MKRLGPTILMVAALAPAAALGGTSTSVASNAARQCSVLRAQIGSPAFSKSFSSFGICVSKLTPLARENTAAARAACSTVARTVFARCVANFAKSVSLLERSTLSFVPLTSTQLEAATTAAASCRSEQASTGFAAAHGGKTFALFYGTNANKANAFGRCVSMKATASQSGRSDLTPAQQQPTQSPSPAVATPPGAMDKGSRCETNDGKGIPRPMGTAECIVGAGA